MALDRNSRPALASKARLRWDRREQVHFLLYPERGLRLSDTAAAILQLCDGSRTIAEIAAALAQRYPAESGSERTDHIEGDVLEFLARLGARGLLSAGAD